MLSRAIVIVTALGACGRIGFDPGGDGGAVDARGDAIDGPSALPSCLPAPPVIYLGFDDNTGLVASDATGNGNDGALIGMDSSNWIAGKYGRALSFDGAAEYVNAQSAASIDDRVPFTICAWIRPRVTPAPYMAIADKSTDGYVGGWNFYIQGPDELGLVTNRRQYAIMNGIVVGQWNHVCAAWDGTDGAAGITFSRDGAAASQVRNGGSGPAGNDSDDVHDLRIGVDNNATYPFDGAIDVFTIFDRVLTPAEMAAVYACGA